MLWRMMSSASSHGPDATCSLSASMTAAWCSKGWYSNLFHWTIRTEAFFDRLVATPHVVAFLELAGANPALVLEAATTYALDCDLGRARRDMMLDDDLSAPRLGSFTTLWLEKCTERLLPRYRMDTIFIRICGGNRQHLPQVARRLLLLVLTAHPSARTSASARRRQQPWEMLSLGVPSKCARKARGWWSACPLSS